MIPIIVIMSTKGDPVAKIPPNTPIKLRKIAIIIMVGLEIELNWKIKIRNMSPNPVKKAPIKKDCCFACSSI